MDRVQPRWEKHDAQLPSLLTTITKAFNVKEVCGDLAYSTKGNLAAIDAVKASPLIPFKCNAQPTTGGLWEKTYFYFHLNNYEILSRYHQRSNVQSTFSMIKAKFGDSVRSKRPLP